MLTPKYVMINITRAMGVVLIALILHEIVKRQPWCEGYIGVTAFLICGSIVLAVVGVYLLIKGNSVAKAALINVNQGFDQFSLATIVVITIKTLGITIMVLMGTALLDTLNYLLCLLDFSHPSLLLRAPGGLMGIKALIYSLILLLFGFYLYVNGKAIYRILHIDINDSCPCGSGEKYKKCCGR